MYNELFSVFSHGIKLKRKGNAETTKKENCKKIFFLNNSSNNNSNDSDIGFDGKINIHAQKKSWIQEKLRKLFHPST